MKAAIWTLNIILGTFLVVNLIMSVLSFKWLKQWNSEEWMDEEVKAESFLGDYPN